MGLEVTRLQYKFNIDDDDDSNNVHFHLILYRFRNILFLPITFRVSYFINLEVFFVKVEKLQFVLIKSLIVSPSAMHLPC